MTEQKRKGVWPPPKYTLPGPSLEADGVIDIYNIDTMKVVAQYEGMEVHEKLIAYPALVAAVDQLSKVARARFTLSELADDPELRQTLQTARAVLDAAEDND